MKAISLEYLNQAVEGTIIPVDLADRKINLATDAAQVLLDLRRGLAISSLTFPALGNLPALGTLPHGYFDDISFGADFYSGHSVVQRPGQRKLTDLQTSTESVTVIKKANGHLVARAEITDSLLNVTKQVEIEASQPRIILSGRLELPSRSPGEIHPVHLTVVPGFFDPDHLHFRTHNGGSAMEQFPLTSSSVHHGASYSTLITAKGGLGATENVVEFGDGQRSLVITHDPCVSAMIPTVRFEKVRAGEYFLRLRYSAQEMDETFVTRDAPWQVEWRVTIEAKRD